METTRSTAADRPGPLLFVVLVPHRDCLPVLEAYRRRLFSAGLDGAHSFPAAAPLALLKRPLCPGELKTAAAELRKLLGDKKIVSLKESECSGWTFGRKTTIRFFGPVLELPLPAFPADAVLQRWEEPILAPAILSSGSCPSRKDVMVPLLLPRAAALTNLALTPVFSAVETGAGSFDGEYSFTWKLGPLYWLPRHAGKKSNPAAQPEKEDG